MHFADASGADLAINAVTNDAVDPTHSNRSSRPARWHCHPHRSPTNQETLCPLIPSPFSPPPSVTKRTPRHPRRVERAYLTGLLAGLRTSLPDGDVPTVPSHAPLSPSSRAWIDGVLGGTARSLAAGTAVTATTAEPATTPPVGIGAGGAPCASCGRRRPAQSRITSRH